MDDTSDIVLDALTDLVLVVTSNGEFCWVSPSCHEILGYEQSEMIGQNGEDFVHPPDLDAVRGEMRAGRDDGTTHRFECRYVSKSGRAVPLQWSGNWSEALQQHIYTGRDVSSIRFWMGINNNVDQRLRSIDDFIADYRVSSIRWHTFTPLDITMTLGSLWAAFMLLTGPSNFDTYPGVFRLLIEVPLGEPGWGCFALTAAVLKIASLVVISSSRNVLAATMLRTVGRLMSALFWTLLGVSYTLGNPEFSMFGPIGVLFGLEAVWAEFGMGRGKRICDWLLDKMGRR